jgi:hypothetical protein
LVCCNVASIMPKVDWRAWVFTHLFCMLLDNLETHRRPWLELVTRLPTMLNNNRIYPAVNNLHAAIPGWNSNSQFSKRSQTIWWLTSWMPLDKVPLHSVLVEAAPSLCGFQLKLWHSNAGLLSILNQQWTSQVG